MSFTAAIDFLDEEGNRFCVPCSGVADNSALTLENFVDVNNTRGEVDDRLVVNSPGPFPSARPRRSRRRGRFARRARKSAAGPRARRAARRGFAQDALAFGCGARRRGRRGMAVAGGDDASRALLARGLALLAARARGASSWTSSSFGAGARSWARPERVPGPARAAERCGSTRPC